MNERIQHAAEFNGNISPRDTNLRAGSRRPAGNFPSLRLGGFALNSRHATGKITQKSQEALQEAQRLARENSHQEIDGEHLALALIGQNESLIPDLLERIGVPVARLKPDLEAELARRHKVQGAASLRRRRFAQVARSRAVRGDQAQGRIRQHRTSVLGLIDGAVRR